MTKSMLGLAGVTALTALLASCGSSGGTVDGSGRIVDLSTEFTSSTNPTTQYAGCDNVGGASSGRQFSTQVKVEFVAVGSIQSIEVSLAGSRTNTADPNFTATVQAADLKKNSAGNYQVLFDANSKTGQLLPASIIVEPNPTEQPEKAVTTSNLVGSFYALVKVNTAASTFTLTSVNLRKVNVYSNCTITAAQPLSK